MLYRLASPFEIGLCHCKRKGRHLLFADTALKEVVISCELAAGDRPFDYPTRSHTIGEEVTRHQRFVSWLIVHVLAASGEQQRRERVLFVRSPFDLRYWFSGCVC